jgi:membrane protein implicated in regulation of membrane protease activity
MGYLLFWGVIFVVMLIAEIASMQLVSIWFAVGAAGAFVAAMMNVSFAAQLAIFVIVSVLLLLLTRPLLTKLRVKQQPRTNADLNIGETAVVIEDIDPALGTGRARLGGIDWIAVSESGENIPVDTVVMVTRVDGAKLFVRDASEYAQPLANGQ